MSRVLVVDTNRQPLDPIHPGRARQLLSQGKAAVLRAVPFTLILKTACPEAQPQPLRLKLDPGSKTTGLVLLNDETGEVVFAAELQHRSQAIKSALAERRASRRFRRQRQTRYRQPRWRNRRRAAGWLSPSRESRLANILTWVRRLRQFAPVAALALELMQFDPQRLEQTTRSGEEYRPGTLAGAEMREYLLEKWQHTCASCGARHLPLQITPIQFPASGGTNQVENLTMACDAFQRARGTQELPVFLATRPDLLKRLLALARVPCKDIPAVNVIRKVLYECLQSSGLPLECGSGGRTAWNRTARQLPQTPWLDAANVGASTPEVLLLKQVRVLQIKATGHGSRQMCSQLAYGFPIGHHLPREQGKPVRGHRQRQKRYFGFQTGDMVRVVIPVGRSKYAGTYVTRITVRANGNFKFRLAGQDISCKYWYCQMIQHSDGYQYTFKQYVNPVQFPGPYRKQERAKSPCLARQTLRG